MPGTTSILRLAFFLLATTACATCFGVDMARFFTIAQTLNEQGKERIQTDLTNLQQKWHLRTDTFHRCGCGGFISQRAPFSSGRHLDLPKKQRSKNSLSDEPIDTLAAAFKESSAFSIFNLLTAAKDQTGVSKKDLYADALIVSRVDTAEILPAHLVFRWLIDNIGENESAALYTGSSTEAEVNEFKQDSHFSPNIVFEFKGKDCLWVELDTYRQKALIRSKDKWGVYDFDGLSAATIEYQALALTWLYGD